MQDLPQSLPRLRGELVGWGAAGTSPPGNRPGTEGAGLWLFGPTREEAAFPRRDARALGLLQFMPNS